MLTEPDAWSDGPRALEHPGAVRPAHPAHPASRRRRGGAATTAAFAAAIFGGIGLVVSLAGLAVQLGTSPTRFQTRDEMDG